MVVLPRAIPVTTPELLIVATEGLLLLQVPPDVASASVMVLPIHTLPGPVIAATAFTETALVTKQLPVII